MKIYNWVLHVIIDIIIIMKNIFIVVMDVITTVFNFQL